MFKVGDIICSIKNPFRQLQILEYFGEEVKVRIVKHDDPKFYIDRIMLLKISDVEKYARKVSKLDKVLE